MLRFRKNYFSQFGEDGIIEYLRDKLGLKDGGLCCEFGAWDGKASSNTFHLVKHKGYKALYIEADKKKFDDLLLTCKEYPNIVPVNEFVDNNLDDIFERYNFPLDIDILSIDIDSTDYEQWKTCKKVNPKIVIIEPDNSIPFWVRFPIYPTSKTGGANYVILEQLGVQKGYTLVCNTSNMIFVRNDLVTDDIEIDNRLFPWHVDESIKRVIFEAVKYPEEFNRYVEGVKLGFIDHTMKSEFNT
jgi:hypothetical protein